MHNVYPHSWLWQWPRPGLVNYLPCISIHWFMLDSISTRTCWLEVTCDITEIWNGNILCLDFFAFIAFKPSNFHSHLNVGLWLDQQLRTLRLCLEHVFGFFVCICILAKMQIYFGWDVNFGANYILDEMCILECTFGDHICICILIAMHTVWRRFAFGGT